MERKILRRFRQFDFVNVDGFRAVPRQDFLGFGFFLRRSDSDQISGGSNWTAAIYGQHAFASLIAINFEHSMFAPEVLGILSATLSTIGLRIFTVRRFA